MSSSRQEVLRRVREAIGMPSGDVVSPAPVARGYRTTGDHPAGSLELIDLLVGRLQDYKATVVRCTGDDEAIGAAIGDALRGAGAESAVIPAGLTPAWSAGAPGVVVDTSELTAGQLDQIHAVVTGSAVAVAETGTIVLDSGPTCGRRIITLVPDIHVCVVHVADVVDSVPEGLALLDPVRPRTFISGPSATSDIELSRVEGVHGPRTLIVVLAG
ncbi:MAG TPA: LUD domain-containing protein [Dermatophilaceae bacterium]